MTETKRFTPYTTVIIAGNAQEADLCRQTEEWCQSESFNPEGQVLIVNRENKTIQKFKKNSRMELTETDGSISEMIRKCKPSCTIDMSGKLSNKIIMLRSHSGINVAQRSLFSLLFFNYSYSKNKKNSLRDAVPFFFNSDSSSRTTSNKKINEELFRDSMNMNGIAVADLGEFPEKPKKNILWIPTLQTAMKDFIKITYMAAESESRIYVFIPNEAFEKKFSAIFFAQGREKDYAKYLSLVKGETLSEAIFGNDSADYSEIIFSQTHFIEYIQTKRKCEKVSSTKVSILISLQEIPVLDGELKVAEMHQAAKDAIRQNVEKIEKIIPRGKFLK